MLKSKSKAFAAYRDIYAPVKMDDSVLLCPLCNDETAINLHHSEITIANRLHEDSDTGMLISAKNCDSLDSYNEEEQGDNNLKVELVADGKMFYGRRDSLTIRFWCENCHEQPILLIYQHKGSTHLRWMVAEK